MPLETDFLIFFRTPKSVQKLTEENLTLLKDIRDLAISSEPVDTVKLTREVRKQFI